MRTLPSGGARIPATIGRTGIQIYRDAEGNVVREYRPQSEVFSEAALESLRHAPVTISHPQDFVTDESYRALSVGHVTDMVATAQEIGAERFVSADLLIHDGGALRGISAKDLVELSAGYTATLDPTPGKTDAGEEYDVIQRDIRYNHVALLPTGQARAGREARLRFDGCQDVCDTLGSETPEPCGMTFKELQEKLAAETARADAAEAALVATKVDETPAVEAEVEAPEVEAPVDEPEAEQEVPAEAEVKTDVASLVEQEIAFRSDMAKHLPADYAFAGKDRAAVKADAVAHLGGKSLGKSEAYCDVFLSEFENAKEDYNNLHAKSDDAAPKPKTIAEIADAAFAASWKK